MGNFIRQDIETVVGFVEDTIQLGRNRSLAEEVRVLVSVVLQKQKATGVPAATLSESLKNTKKLLQRAVEPPAEAERPRTFHMEWGRETETQGERKGTSEAKATLCTAVMSESVEPGRSDVEAQRSPAELIAVEKPIVQEAPTKAWEETTSQEQGPNAQIVGAAIELCDWLDRVGENESIASERVVAITRQKGDSLLSSLGVERIDAQGAFNQMYQQLVDNVATDSAEKDMQVCQTVQCGYRTRRKIIRPQLVMIYRFNAGKSETLQN